MPTLSTTYGPGSVTTTTPGIESSSFDLKSNAPDTSFLSELLRRRMEKEAEEKRLRAAAEQREDEMHQLRLHQANQANRQSAMDSQFQERQRARQEMEAAGPVPDKWITELVPTGYGHMRVRNINPLYEKWAAKRGQYDVGPDGVSIAQSIQPASSLTEPVEDMAKSAALNDYIAKLSRPKDGGNERPDWYGSGGM